MAGDKKIAVYVEAVREHAIYLRQLAKDPTLKTKPKWLELYNAAVVAKDTAYRDLRGGWLGRARRILAADATPTPEEETPAS